jgi:hypothetical protein
MPCGPWGRTKFNVCEGLVPVIVALAEPPSTTVPIFKTLEGPGPPIIPSTPLGNVKFNIALDAVPTFTTDAGVAALTVVTVPTAKVPEGPCGPGLAAMNVAMSAPRFPRSLGTSGVSV